MNMEGGPQSRAHKKRLQETVNALKEKREQERVARRGETVKKIARGIKRAWVNARGGEELIAAKKEARSYQEARNERAQAIRQERSARDQARAEEWEVIDDANRRFDKAKRREAFGLSTEGISEDYDREQIKKEAIQLEQEQELLKERQEQIDRELAGVRARLNLKPVEQGPKAEERKVA